MGDDNKTPVVPAPRGVETVLVLPPPPLPPPHSMPLPPPLVHPLHVYPPAAPPPTPVVSSFAPPSESPIPPPHPNAPTVPAHPQRPQGWEEEQRKKKLAAAANSTERERRYLVADLVGRGIPGKDIDAILGSTLTDNESMDAVDHLHESEDWALVLAGGPGVGKTTAAAFLAARRPPGLFRPSDADWDDNHKDMDGRLLPPRWPARLRPRFITASALVEIDRYKDGDLLDVLRKCSLLCIDDLGAEYSDQKGFFQSFLDSLINSRYSMGLKTCITTNLKMGEFKDRVGERIVDRIREGGKFVSIDDKSYRGGNKT